MVGQHQVEIEYMADVPAEVVYLPAIQRMPDRSLRGICAAQAHFPAIQSKLFSADVLQLPALKLLPAFSVRPTELPLVRKASDLDRVMG